MKVLVINAGSSSLKYQLLDPETGHLLAKGLCERIGIDGKFTYKPQVEGKAVISAADVPMPPRPSRRCWPLWWTRSTASSPP